MLFISLDTLKPNLPSDLGVKYFNKINTVRGKVFVYKLSESVSTNRHIATFRCNPDKREYSYVFCISPHLKLGQTFFIRTNSDICYH